MRLSINTILLTVLASLLSLPVFAEIPPTPQLSYLYTAYVKCTGNLLEPATNGPYGLRKTIPIVGGNITGPRLSGMLPSLLLWFNG